MQGCQARKKNRSQVKSGSQANFQPNQRRPNLSGGGRGGTLRGAMNRRPGIVLEHSSKVVLIQY